MGKIKEGLIAEELPYWDFLDTKIPHILNSDLSITAGLELTMTNIECALNCEINIFTEKLAQLIDSAPENCNVQFIHRVDSNYRDLLTRYAEQKSDSAPEIARELAWARVNRIENEVERCGLMRPRFYMLLTIRGGQSQGYSLFKKPQQFENQSEAAYLALCGELKAHIDTLDSCCRDAGLAPAPIPRCELIELIYQSLNPKRSGVTPSPLIFSPENPQADNSQLEIDPWLAVESARSQLAFGDLILNLEYFILDGRAHRIITLKTLPELTVAGQMSEFLKFPFHFELVVNVHVPKQSIEMRKLNTKRRMAHSMAISHSNQVRDLESESRLSSSEELIRELINTSQRIYAVELIIILREEASSAGLMRLEQQTRQVLAKFRALNGAEGLSESVASWKIFKSALPGRSGPLVRAKRMKTSSLSDFIPAYGPETPNCQPAILFHSRDRSLIAYDSFDSNLINYNVLVTGASGSGKSFLNNFILSSEVLRGTKCFIIDIGGSYKKACHAFEGEYVEINLSGEYKLNPFWIPDVGSAPSSEKVKSLLSIIENMVSDVTEPLTRLDRALLEKSILDTFGVCRANLKMPRLRDFVKVCEASTEVSLLRFAKILFSWTGERAYGKLLDCEETFSPEKSVTAFDLKGLSQYPDLQSVVVLSLTGFILSEVEKDPSRHKRIFLDEAWSLLKSRSSAEFMEYCARTLRKTGSGITFITQGLEEICASPIGSAIINCTNTKIILRQQGDPKLLADTVRLNSRAVALCDSLQQKKGVFSEALLVRGDHMQVVRIYPTPLDYWTFTSDAKDNRFLEAKMSEGLTLLQAIKFASTHAPSGISQLREVVA